MKYRVHKIEVNRETMQEKVQQFINTLDGDVVSVIPNFVPFVMIYGAKINYVLVIEKMK